MKVLLSIKPEFVKKIIGGEKKLEYRKRIFKRNDISVVVVYATKPYGKVVGEFEIGDIMQACPADLWQATNQFAGICEEEFNKYFGDREVGFAIEIKKFVKYKSDLDLHCFNQGIAVAPQSFCYIERGD